MANITYRQVADYMIPNLTLPHGESTIRLSKWGMMHKSYLEKHKKALFSSLLIEGKLFQHCAEIEKQANEMYDVLIEQLKEAESITENLKEDNQWEWVQRMGDIQQRAREIVCSELIYS